jgi:hypothetical protein
MQYLQTDVSWSRCRAACTTHDITAQLVASLLPSLPERSQEQQSPEASDAPSQCRKNGSRQRCLACVLLQRLRELLGHPVGLEASTHRLCQGAFSPRLAHEIAEDEVAPCLQSAHTYWHKEDCHRQQNSATQCNGRRARYDVTEEVIPLITPHVTSAFLREARAAPVSAPS